MNRKLRMGAISFEHGHQYGWMRAMLRLPSVELVAISEPDERLRARALAEIHAYDRLAFGHDPDQGDVRVYAEHADLIGATDIEAVSICAANVQHHALTVAAAAADKHVLCEKPLAVSLDEATDMVRACRSAEVQLGLAYPVRHAPAAWEAKQRLAAGELGAIQAMSVTNVLRAATVGWFIDPEKSGGGAIRDHIVHGTDLMRWLSAREVREIYCEADPRMRDIPVEDTGMLIEVFENGVIGTCDPSWNRPLTWPKWGDVTARILCARGVLEIDVTGDYVALTDASSPRPGYAPSPRTRGEGGGEGPAWPPPPPHRHLGFGASMDHYLLQDFAASVLAGRAPCASGRDGWAGVACIEAAYASARTHRFVEVAQFADHVTW
ncbi:MAG: Gfo/Idh/MocA family oxidoreductase [Actinobacteria bacterium]|nr:Gfo/Idh/MocA family oxidoreductase [Actinomycetota bacterium]